MIWIFPKEKITEEVWNYLDSVYYVDRINYVLHSDYRKSTKVCSWLKEQPYIKVDSIPIGESNDETMLNILRWVKNNITYTSDLKQWKMSEYWQTGNETLTYLKGDCEDGAILIYLIAREKGIPANRLLLMAGDVEGGGHCWLAYKPDSYPINFIFLDWCYFVNLNYFRTVYDIQDKTIIGDDNYKKLWFAFNELKSYSILRYTPYDN
jgi:transglutaminase-like putative cysteine protease